MTAYVGMIFVLLAKAGRLYYPLVIALFIFVAFRFEVGCDWTGYFNQFSLYNIMPLDTILKEQEPLWKGLFAIQNSLDLPYPWINVFSAVIFFSGVHSLARRQPNPLAFWVLLFPILIINIPMSAIRQASAIGVICAALVAFIDQKLLFTQAQLYLCFSPPSSMEPIQRRV